MMPIPSPAAMTMCARSAISARTVNAHPVQPWIATTTILVRMIPATRKMAVSTATTLVRAATPISVRRATYAQGAPAYPEQPRTAMTTMSARTTLASPPWDASTAAMPQPVTMVQVARSVTNAPGGSAFRGRQLTATMAIIVLTIRVTASSVVSTPITQMRATTTASAQLATPVQQASASAPGR